MGYYVNPKNMSKEAFLQIFGKKISEAEFKAGNFSDTKTSGGTVVVLVDNGPFTAGLICYSHDEYQYMIENPDNRRKEYFIVPSEKLEEFM